MVIATRPLRGSRLSSFYPPVPDERPSLAEFDSAFQLQEYISILIRQNPHDVESIVALPGRARKGDQDDKDKSEPDGKNDGVDEACWIYEQLRRLAQDLTHPLITSLQQECTRASCPEMKAGEWLYLCVAHGNDGAMEQCCAIDYIIHTLDSATALLNSPRAFPSRISIPQPSIRHFSSLARRLGRIFSHAYFHHREVFESAEAENSLYARFLALTARFDLVPPDFLVIPSRIANTDASSNSADDAEPPRLLAAALHPEPRAMGENERERASVSIMESPRKAGRSRTDTMVLSDAEAFTEALRGQGGSPTSFGQEKGKDVSSDGQMGGLGLDNTGLPHVDSLEVLAESTEACRPHVVSSDKEGEGSDVEKEKENKTYTLTFSASGTMKTALPPGVSPSQSVANGIGLAPSPLQVQDNNDGINDDFQQNISNQGSNGFNNTASGAGSVSQFASLGFPRGNSQGPAPEFEDPISIEKDRSPSPELEGPLLSTDDSEDLRYLIEETLLAERMRDVELGAARSSDGGDTSSKDGDAVENAEKQGEGGFVVIESEDSDDNAATESHQDAPAETTTEADDGEPEAQPAVAGDELNPDGTAVTLEKPSDGIGANSATEASSGVKSQDSDTSLEMDLADVEKALRD